MIRHHKYTSNSKTGLSQRRGSVFVWFAVFLFVLFPLITLILHTGIVTLTRRQMQTAVNTAALEGVRLSGDSSLTEEQRREGVQSLVSNVFDDNLNPANGDSLQIGAGPIIAFDNEPTDISLPDTEFKASRRIRAGNLSVYDPVLNPNLANEQHGDMVRGQFAPNGDHVEENDYSRADFLQSGDAGYVAATGDDAFLVRLRRTDDPQNLDAVANVSSHGPTIPFLFGRGPYGGTSFLDRRERGTIVRATGIAQAVPAMTVGIYSVDAMHGVAPIWIELSAWNPLTIGSSTAVTITPPAMSPGSTTITGGVTGEYTQPQVVAVGDNLLSMTDPAPSIVGMRFIAIYSDIAGTNRVVGFGMAVLDLNPSLGSGTVEKLESGVASGNASATWRSNVSGLSDAEVDDLFDPSHAVSEHLLAPALVRSIR